MLRDLSTVPVVNRLRPMVLLSLITGLRRGEVFSLTWAEIDLVIANLTVQGLKAKTGRTRHIPLNEEPVNILRAWKPEHARSSDLVFSGKGGEALNNVRRAWLGVHENGGHSEIPLARSSPFIRVKPRHGGCGPQYGSGIARPF
jgi:integrase